MMFRKPVLAALSGLLATSLVLTGGASMANADPASDLAQARSAAAAANRSLASAQAELDRLDALVGDLEEKYGQAKIEQEASAQRAAALQADVTAQAAKVEALHQQAAGFARAAFQNAGVDQTAQLFVSGDPESFLQQISTASKVDENMNDVLQRYQAEQANLGDLKRAADAEAARTTAAATQMAQAEAEAERSLAEAQDLVSSLSAEQRAALDQIQSAQAAAAAAAQAAAPAAAVPAAAAAPAAAAPSAPAAKAVAPAPAATPVADAGAPSSAAAKAVAFARAHLGDRYVWAAEGPNAFDCSGFTLSAYRAAGISLPHSSSAQSGIGRSVSRSDLQPGDLLFWYSPIHHVALYVGDGMMIHAQNPRVGVVSTPVSQWLGYGIYFAGARRVS